MYCLCEVDGGVCLFGGVMGCTFVFDVGGYYLYVLVIVSFLIL